MPTAGLIFQYLSQTPAILKEWQGIQTWIKCEPCPLRDEEISEDINYNPEAVTQVVLKDIQYYTDLNSDRFSGAGGSQTGGLRTSFVETSFFKNRWKGAGVWFSW